VEEKCCDNCDHLRKVSPADGFQRCVRPGSPVEAVAQQWSREFWCCYHEKRKEPKYPQLPRNIDEGQRMYETACAERDKYRKVVDAVKAAGSPGRWRSRAAAAEATSNSQGAAEYRAIAHALVVLEENA
jgi:hypothetical protein